MKLSELVDLNDQPVVNESKNENKNLSKAPPSGDIAPLMTTAQAAKEIGVTQSRVRQFIMDGRLKAKKPKKGRRDNMLSADSVRKFAKKERKITGRPEEK
jgi:excisionase family DNA binding protein